MREGIATTRKELPPHLIMEGSSGEKISFIHLLEFQISVSVLSDQLLHLMFMMNNKQAINSKHRLGVYTMSFGDTRDFSFRYKSRTPRPSR